MDRLRDTAGRIGRALSAARMSPYGEGLLLFVLASVGVWQAWRFHSTTYDDVFLAYRYAQNVLDGHGFVYNPGENFLGTPAPFFVLILVALKRVLGFMDIVEIGGWVSGVSLTLCGLVIYLLARHFRQRLAGAVAFFLIIFNPLIVMTLGGETPLYLMLISAAFLCYFREQLPLTGFLLALAIMTRGEAIGPAVVLLGYTLVARREIPWSAIIALVATLMPWLIYSFVVFGSPLTNSLGAKIAQRKAGLGAFIPGARWWIIEIAFLKDPRALAFLPLSVLGVLASFWKGRGWLPFFAWIVAQTAGYLALDLPFYHWYIAHIGLGLSVLAALGVALPMWVDSSDMGWSDVRVALRRCRYPPLARTLGFAFVSLCLLLVAVSSVRAAESYHIGMPNPCNRIYVKTGRWLAGHTPPDSSVAYLEIGQIGYYSRRPIVDVLGLVTAGAAQRVAKNDFLWVYLAYQPDYIIYNAIFDNWIGAVLDQSWFQEAYHRVKRIRDPGYPTRLIIFEKDPEVPLPPPADLESAHSLHDAAAGEVLHGRPVGQTFVSESPNLSAIGVLLATFARDNTKSVSFHLRECPSSATDLVHIEFPASGVHDDKWRVFYFDPLPHSEGESYYFFFDSPESHEGDAITAWMSTQDVYPAGSLMIGHQPTEGDLAFRTYVLSEKP
jgi:hypothetical protein